MISISVERRGDFVWIDLEANAFLHHMVRNIVGSLLLVGLGYGISNGSLTCLMERIEQWRAIHAAGAGLLLSGCSIS